MNTVKVRIQTKLFVEVDLEIQYDKMHGEAVVVGGEISPTFSVRPRAIYENLSQGDFQKLDRRAKDAVLHEALVEWRKYASGDPSGYPEEGIRTIPLPPQKWAETVQKESGLHVRIHTHGVLQALDSLDLLVEPALEREPSLYLWEVNPGSGELDRAEKRFKTQLRKAMTTRMPDGSMRAHWNT